MAPRPAVLWERQGDFADLHVDYSAFDFGYLAKVNPYQGDETWGPFQVPTVAPCDLHAVAIAEDSEVRGVWMRAIGKPWARIIEGSPLPYSIKHGETIELDRHDYTSGRLELVFATRDCKSLFDALPVLILDHARVRRRGSQFGDQDTTTQFTVQAPRIRGVRHRAGMIRGLTGGTNLTVELGGSYLEPTYHHRQWRARSAADSFHASLLFESFTDWTPTADVAGSSLTATDADLLWVTFIPETEGDPIEDTDQFVFGWVAPS